MFGCSSINLFIDMKTDSKVRIRAPVFKKLLRYLIAGCFEFGDKGFKII